MYQIKNLMLSDGGAKDTKFKTPKAPVIPKVTTPTKSSGTASASVAQAVATPSVSMPSFSFAPKPQYTSRYQGTIDSLMDKIVNRKDFSYDFNADPLYQQYKDQYTKMGAEAAMNVQANAATLSGGFGNSYGATAASQANQQYLTQLNDVIPELYNAAFNKYNMELDNMRNDLGMYQNAESMDYAKYRDNVSDYYTDYSNAYTKYRDDYSDALRNAAMVASSASKTSSGGTSKKADTTTKEDTKAKTSESYASLSDLNKYLANAQSLVHASVSAPAGGRQPSESYIDSLYKQGKINEAEWNALLDRIERIAK